MEIALITGSSILGIGFITKAGTKVCNYIIVDVIRKKEKKKLKNRLSTSIDNLEYHNFIQCIYDIKRYDTKYYPKQLYYKLKKFYKFQDSILKNENNFKRRFAENYECDSDIKDFVRNEIEISLSRKAVSL